jgi:hypothetical protein
MAYFQNFLLQMHYQSNLLLLLFFAYRAAWIVLFTELFLEFLIRPKSYHELIRSDKAFAPSSARFLNRFHFICESLSLLLYVPQLVCGLSGNCTIAFGASRRTLWALTSTSKGKSFVGRFLLGSTFLRSFGLARHWKQMWLNHTFDRHDQEHCKYQNGKNIHWISLVIVLTFPNFLCPHRSSHYSSTPIC